MTHGNPNGGALLLYAAWAVDSLYYLSDIDRTHDLSQATIAGHRPDVVEVAHARWATSTCITALDLCAAGMGRVFCGHTVVRELAISDLHPRGRRADLRPLLPRQALQWIDAIFADPRYKQIKAVRDALTHSRVFRHITFPRQRLQIQVKKDRLDVPSVIDYAKGVATTHVSTLLTILPAL